MNKVLTLEEVLALPEGARVWVELSTLGTTGEGEHTKGEHGRLYDAVGCYWGHNPYPFGRVWSLPQPPTDDELAANPWPEALA